MERRRGACRNLRNVTPLPQQMVLEPSPSESDTVGAGLAPSTPQHIIVLRARPPRRLYSRWALAAAQDISRQAFCCRLMLRGRGLVVD
jgi:hypothetical protein